MPMGMVKLRSTAVLFGLLMLSGCSFLEMRELRILSLHPSKSFVEHPARLHPRVRFSAVMDKTAGEEAFSLTAGEEPVGGSFSWPDPCTLVFVPHSPLRENREYCLRISTAACDRYGNSLLRARMQRFSSAAERQRPTVTEILPEDGSRPADPRTPVIITFSEAMCLPSVLNSFSISPAVRGAFSWNSTGEQLTFTPLEDYRRGGDYTVTVGEEAADLSGNTLTGQAESLFTAGAGYTPLHILSVTDGTGSIALTPAPSSGEAGSVTAGLERNSEFLLTFSRSIRIGSWEHALRFSPSIPFHCRREGPENRILRVIPDRPLSWGEVYSLIAGEGLEDRHGNRLREEERFRLRVNGPKSRPPEIRACYFLTDPTAGTIERMEYGREVSLSAYTGGAAGFFDLYFTCAEGACMEPLELMGGLSLYVEGEAAHAELLAIEAEELAPPPAAEPAPEESILRIRLSIEPLPPPGMLSMQVSAGTSDSVGNPLCEDWTMLLNITD